MSEADTVLGTTPVITQAIVEKYILKMKKHKTASASVVVTEKLKVTSDTFSKMIADLKIPLFVTAQYLVTRMLASLSAYLKVKVKY